jgi:YD repeat-containing protein
MVLRFLKCCSVLPWVWLFGVSVAAQGGTIRYIYDELGRLVGVIDQNGDAAVCDQGENCEQCPEDCECECGNNACDPGESCTGCAEDCEDACICGDSVCDWQEKQAAILGACPSNRH